VQGLRKKGRHALFEGVFQTTNRTSKILTERKERKENGKGCAGLIV